MPVYTRHHWGKSDRQDHQRIHLLEHHLADVAACFEALLKQPTIRKRLAGAGGLSDLDGTTAARLCVLAALHDVGKVNIGFQTQIWRAEDLPPQRKRPPRTGHDRDLAPILTGADGKTAQWFSSALGWNELLGWDDCGGETVCALFIAALSHHGLPLNLRERGPNPSIWRPFSELNPQLCVERIARLVRKWFPAAFAREAPPLPSRLNSNTRSWDCVRWPTGSVPTRTGFRTMTSRRTTTSTWLAPEPQSRSAKSAST